VLGEVLSDRYELLEELGRGGMAVVYRARDRALGRDVAVKVLGPDRRGDDRFVRRFEREARAVAALDHPNVVSIHDTGTHDGIPYLVMGYVRGPSLADLLGREGPLDAERAAAIAHEISGGLAAAHRRGIIHRDVKPSNVMFDTVNDTVKVTDFGLARAVDEATVTTTVYGSAPYMAPEQARGDDVTAAADVYAVGCVLHHMLIGRPPFTGDSPLAVVSQHLSAEPPPIHELRPEVPADLADVVARCLRKEPSERFSDAGELSTALERFAGVAAGAAPVSATQVLGETAGTTAVDASTGDGRTGRWPQALLLGALALIGIALVVWSLTDDEPPAATVAGDQPAQEEGAAGGDPTQNEPEDVDEMARDFVRAVLAGEREGEVDEDAADELAKRGEEMLKKHREGKLREVGDEIHEARVVLDEAIADGEVRPGPAETLGARLDAMADALGVPRPQPSPGRGDPTPGG
jgi:eukaryotic-like serine/threonine-protein kinase